MFTLQNMGSGFLHVTTQTHVFETSRDGTRELCPAAMEHANGSYAAVDI